MEIRQLLGAVPKLVIFDLDRTLTESKMPLADDMAKRMRLLLGLVPVVIITGGRFEQLIDQFVSRLGSDTRQLRRLYLAPTSGGRLYAYEGKWHVIYANDLAWSERGRIIHLMREMLETKGFQDMTGDDEIGKYGPVIEDRGSQVTFSALGMSAPSEKKEAWDPERKKRLWIAEYLSKRLPEYEVRTGGSTSVDVTHRGVDKGTAIEKISFSLGVSKQEMLFIGDALEVGGNDNPVFQHGVLSIDVDSLNRTMEVIDSLLASLG